MKLFSLATLTALSLMMAGCDQSPVTSEAAEEAAYKSCNVCHGASGLGNRGMQAPSLVNLDDWYVERQLRHFKAGIRGRHSRDTYGMQMASQASLLKSDQMIEAVVRRINSFPDKSPLATIQADQESGQRLYNTHCSSCHGAEGKGNRELNAPSLRGIDDWYLVRQYDNFQQGIRGSHADDLYGQQMQQAAQVLSEQEMKDVAAWLISQGIDY